MYGSTSRPALLANQITGWLASRRIELVPGKNVRWDPPIDEGLLKDWLLRASEALGRHVEWWVTQLPMDMRRRRFNLLLLDSSRVPVGFAKFTRNRPNPMYLTALARFTETPTMSFWSPGLAFADQLEDYSVVLTSPMPNGFHRPSVLSRDVRRRIFDEIGDRLDDLAAPGVAVHGDFAPWNVRSLAKGGIAVLDWEELTSGVVGADELWYAVCSRALAGNDRPPVMEQLVAGSLYSFADMAAAARFWIDRLNQVEQEEIDPDRPIALKLNKFSRRVRSNLEELARAS